MFAALAAAGQGRPDTHAMPRVLLAGNPNTGKTTIFNRLCGVRAKTANFPGTTATLRVGRADLGEGRSMQVIDLPGLYRLDVDGEEARSAREMLRGDDGHGPAAVVVIVDGANLARNLDLSLKVRVSEGGFEATPWMLGFVGGVAVNPGPDAFDAFDSQSLQYYGQGILDVLVSARFAAGVVPSVLYNVDPLDPDQETTVGVGIHGQFYVSEAFSVLGEWQFVEDNPAPSLGRDVGTLGVELETGGHFFKLVVSNSTRLNPGQFLGGAADSFDPDNWRLGFNVTRILTF